MKKKSYSLIADTQKKVGQSSQQTYESGKKYESNFSPLRSWANCSGLYNKIAFILLKLPIFINNLLLAY